MPGNFPDLRRDPPWNTFARIDPWVLLSCELLTTNHKYSREKILSYECTGSIIDGYQEE
jgi:hypothetical protein